ncbi:MAG: hypothetical protein JXC32_10760 [Anaerolineae bacterium]|nr:hypothetical protein [Anaerolineae bacterium]
MENTPIFANQLGLIIAFVVIAVVFVAVVVAVASQRRSEENREEALLRLGYEPVRPPPQELVDRILSLRRSGGHQKLELRQVFWRSIAGGEIYVFDLLDTAGDETSSLVDTALAVVSPALDLPRFTVIPRLALSGQANGLLARLADKALAWAASRAGVEEITFDGDLEFNEAFITLTDEASAASTFLTDRRRTEILQMERRYVIDAEADTFVLSRNPSEQQTERPLSERTFEQREDAERILSWFGSGGVRYT